MRGSGPRNGPIADRHWRGSARLAAACALAFCGLAVLVDWDAHTLTAARAVVWIAMSAAVFAVLLPQRVTAGTGWLTVRGPLCRRTVRTDALVSVRRSAGVTDRLVLRDTHGGRLELDIHVLTANPLLWHELDTGLRRSVHRGTLHSGADTFRRLGEQIDTETARAVLRASGLS